MKSRKHSFFIVTNAALGLVTCMVYLYVWISLTFMEPMWSWQPLLGCTICFLFFILWNKWLLKRERSRYWAQAFFSYLTAIIVFIYFLSR